MNLTEREETTKYVVTTIDTFLKREEYTPAILLASIYVSIRLRSKLIDYSSPSKDKWKENHAKLDRLTFNGLLTRCKKVRIITKEDYDKLNDLREQRNNVAHESKLWREPSSNDIEDIKQNCEFVKNFLQRTNQVTN